MSYLNKMAGVAVAASVALGGMATSVLAASIVSFNGPAGEAYVGRFVRPSVRRRRLLLPAAKILQLAGNNYLGRIHGDRRW